MIRVTDANALTFLSAIQASQARSSQAMDQITTGYKVTKPSDAPADVTDIIRLNAKISLGNQVSKNLSQAKSQADIADTTLQTALNLIENALQIATQATDTSIDGPTRA